CARKQDSMDVW
nr:immunoglobulin heavy chain junction region [Macaca mulatta]